MARSRDIEPVSLALRIDDTTPVPAFEQLRAQIALAVATGRLRPGDRLPTVRTLADQMSVAPNTIARAYRELIATGVCEAAGRRGTFITKTPPIAPAIANRSEALTAAADRFAMAVRELGVPIDEALESVIASMRNSG